MQVTTEIWKDVPGYEGLYEASDLGRFRNSSGKLLKPGRTTAGYYTVCLTTGFKRKSMYCHRILAEMFIPNPEKKPQINHKNGDRGDYRLSNLEWCTVSENILHSYTVLKRRPPGLGVRNSDNPRSRAIQMFSMDGIFLRHYDSATDAARRSGFFRPNVCSALRGSRPHHMGFLFKYAPIIVCLFLFSCTTTKYIDREKIVVDSSAITQNEQLQELYATTVARYEKQLQDSSGVRVEFITDTIQLPGSVVVDRSGTLSVQGRIKSVQLSNTQLLRERGELSRMVDSLTAVKQKTEVRVETKTVTVEKKVKRGWPWWWLIIGLIAGWIARGYWPRVRLLFKTYTS